jgi:hypothetical protein
MKSTYIFFISAILTVSFCKSSFSQEQGTDTTITVSDSTMVISEDSTENDPVKAKIIEIIKEVNRRSELVDNIISSGDVKVKIPPKKGAEGIDQSGSIEIHVKKKDDVWFDITGTFGVRGAMAHFNRKNFVFFNSLADEVITGSSSIINIGTLTKIRCTFDDLLNGFSGTVRIPKSKKDELSMTEEGSEYVLSLKRGTVTRKYWVDKNNYLVYKYAYYGKSGSILLQIDFSNFSTYGESNYAKRIEIRRPKQGEYFSISLETVNLNQNNVSFSVDYPSDVKIKKWH